MDFKDDATVFHLECHQGHKNDSNRGSVATFFCGDDDHPPMGPVHPSGQAPEGTDGLWERPLARRGIAQPGRARTRQARGGHTAWGEGVPCNSPPGPTSDGHL